jgi:hypothetical protein
MFVNIQPSAAAPKGHLVHIVADMPAPVHIGRRDQQIEASQQRRAASQLAPDQKRQHYQGGTEQRRSKPGGGIIIAEQEEEQRADMVEEWAVQQGVVNKTQASEQPPRVVGVMGLIVVQRAIAKQIEVRQQRQHEQRQVG